MKTDSPDAGKQKSRCSVPPLVWSVIRITGTVGVFYVLMCAFLYFRQSSYVYYPTRPVNLTPRSWSMSYENVEISTEDGETLSGWYVPASTNAETAGGKPAVLFCHGNGGNIADRLCSIKTFRDMGFNVLIFDYRGYGESTGKTDEQGTYNDAAAVWRYLVEQRNIRPERIVIFGRSLGGSIAAWLAERVNCGALVIESTFTSAPDMAAKMFPFLPGRLICSFSYDSAKRIDRAGCPVVIAHSRDDEMIPFDHGQRLFESAREPKLFVEMSGSHNAGGLDADPEYQANLSEFLKKHLGAAQDSDFSPSGTQH
ncbi:MAG: alpha/beta hydrolase [Kiritimatiellia bacterium]